MTIAQERRSAPRRGHEPRDPRREATDDVTTHFTPADLPVLHLQVEHRLVEVNCLYQVVSHPPGDLIQSSEFAALIKMNKSDFPTHQTGYPLM